MSDTTSDPTYLKPIPPSFPKPNQPFASAEKAAYAALNALISEAITTNEVGGMICQHGDSFYVMRPRLGIRNSVDPGHRDPKACVVEGMPPLKPVAYYHTHPTLDGAEMHLHPDEFSTKDTNVASDNNIDAYVGSLSGLFLKYDRRRKDTYIAGPCLKTYPADPATACAPIRPADKTYPEMPNRWW